MNELLKGQVALVTGGTAGIGKAIAKQFAKQGAKVIIFGTNRERGKNVVEEVRAEMPGSGIEFFSVDVSDGEKIDATVKEIIDRYGQVDILVNNAGITRDQLLLKMKEEDWDRVIDVNVKSCYRLCRALARAMMKARRGSIINMSSVIGLTGNAGQVNYAASKAAVIGFTKALAKELAARNIRVNAIAPGFIQTAMTDRMTEEQKQAIHESIPLKRLGEPDDIAKAALFLASDLSSYVTGQVLTIDGGMVMHAG